MGAGRADGRESLRYPRLGTRTTRHRVPNIALRITSGLAAAEEAAALFLLLAAAQGVAHQPEHRRPEADEERPPFGVAAFVLADRLRPDPEDHAEHDRAEREQVEVGAAGPDAPREELEHRLSVTDAAHGVPRAGSGYDEGVSTKLPAHRRWSTALRWPYGVALASWRYMWSTTPVHRWVMTGSW